MTTTDTQNHVLWLCTVQQQHMHLTQLPEPAPLVSCLLYPAPGGAEAARKAQQLLWQLCDPESHHYAHEVGVQTNIWGSAQEKL